MRKKNTMNNEPQASQETLGDTSQGGSDADSSVVMIKKYAKKIILVMLTLFVVVETVRRELETAAEDSKVSIAINLNSASQSPQTTWTTTPSTTPASGSSATTATPPPLV